MQSVIDQLPAYEHLRNARREVLAVNDPDAQAALFTLLGLIDMLANAIREGARP